MFERMRAASAALACALALTGGMAVMGCTPVSGVEPAGRSAGTVGVPAAVQPSPQVRSELAPSGRLRAAINLGNVVLARPGGPRGAVGPSVDIADELARRLGVPVDFVIYNAAGDVVDRMASDQWGIGFMAIDPKRAEQIGFTAPYVYIEGTYLVRAGAPYRSVTQMDQPGRRIVVGKGAAYDLYLSRTLKHASLIRVATSTEAINAFKNDPSIDTVAGVREALEQEQASSPGYRVLPDAFNRIEQAVAIPQGRPAAQAWVGSVVEELKASGFVRAALDRAGQNGARVAEPAAR